jgi:hypothetical protein
VLSAPIVDRERARLVEISDRKRKDESDETGNQIRSRALFLGSGLAAGGGGATERSAGELGIP